MSILHSGSNGHKLTKFGVYRYLKKTLEQVKQVSVQLLSPLFLEGEWTWQWGRTSCELLAFSPENFRPLGGGEEGEEFCLMLCVWSCDPVHPGHSCSISEQGSVCCVSWGFLWAPWWSLMFDLVWHSEPFVLSSNNCARPCIGSVSIGEAEGVCPVPTPGTPGMLAVLWCLPGPATCHPHKGHSWSRGRSLCSAACLNCGEDGRRWWDFASYGMFWVVALRDGDGQVMNEISLRERWPWKILKWMARESLVQSAKRGKRRGRSEAGSSSWGLSNPTANSIPAWRGGRETRDNDSASWMLLFSLSHCLFTIIGVLDPQCLGFFSFIAHLEISSSLPKQQHPSSPCRLRNILVRPLI